MTVYSLPSLYFQLSEEKENPFFSAKVLKTFVVSKIQPA